MSNLPEKSEIMSNKVVDMLVGNAFKKNGIDIESAKEKLSADQKKAFKELVEELKDQVDAFVKPKPSQKDSK